MTIEPAVTAPNQLSAADAAWAIRDGRLSVEELARACLERAEAREPTLKAWAFLDRDRVIAQARALDASPQKGPLHGVPIAVKDVIQTADMPTQHNSPLYEGSRPGVDAGCIKTLRAAGALIFGKTDTTEFAAVTRGGTARNPFDPGRTPGGSSSGSAAVVADLQTPVALGTQTGGSTIRPASFCGIYALKPTWNAVTREGLKMLSATLDTLGIYARSADDLALLAEVFDFEDRAPAKPFAIEGSRIAACRSPVWAQAEPATRNAFDRGVMLLREAGADVVELDLPEAFAALPAHQRTIMHAEARASLLSEWRARPDLLAEDLTAMAANRRGISKNALLDAYDAAAECRPAFDRVAAEFDAILTPSAVGEAPAGTETGDAAFNGQWTLLHVPVINLPGFAGPNGMPVGLSLTSARYTDLRLIAIAQAIGPLFEAKGGWRKPVL